jgi:type I restriction enzyme S subunit
MSSEWISIPASEFCLSVRDGTHDSPKEVLSGGKNLVTSRHIKGGLLDLSTSYKISGSDYEEINKRSKVDQWDILFSMIGTVGEVLLVKDPPDFAIKNVGLFKSKDEITGKWLYYYLQSPNAKEEIFMSMRGSTQQYIPLGALRSFPIRHPQSTGEMREITNILGTLDDKIELNRKTNETLEAIAKALFKSWFVDFDPVRAKAEGRPTGLPAEISDLFPDSFEDSELGEIPSGWSVAALSDIARISTGKRPASVADSRSSANHIPVYGGAGVMGYTRNALTDGEPILATGRVGTLGVVNRVLEKAWISDNTLIINPGKTNFVYVYHFLLTQDLKSLNRGSTQPLLSQTELKSLPIARPPQSLLSTFCELTQHWQERQASLLKDNVNTKALLDALLPKLISGEIRIPDAEKMLEEVGV